MTLAALATALLYAATGLAASSGAARLLLPISWRSRFVLLLLPLAFTGEAVLTGKVYAPIGHAFASEPLTSVAAELGVRPAFNPALHDLYTAIIPWHAAVRHAWSVGEWPLLNPFLLAGDVLLGSAQPAPFYPPNLLSLAVPLPHALTFLAALQFGLAALGLFLLARELGCREGAALFGAATWCFCGFVVFWIGWPLGVTMTLLPWVLLAVRRLVEAPGWPTAGLLLTVLAVGLLAGHPESAAHLVGVGGVYGLARLAGRNRSAWLATIRWTLVAGSLALALTALFWLPVLDALTQTFEWELRQAAIHHREGAETLNESLRRFAPNVLPFFYGIGKHTAEGEPAGLVPLAHAYVGSLALGLALFGLARSAGRERFVFAGLGLMGFFAGAKLTGFYELLSWIPPFDLALNDRLIAVAGLALAILAALGLETCLAEERWRSLARWLLGTTAALGLLLLATASDMAERGLSASFLVERGAWLLLPPLLGAGWVAWRHTRPATVAGLLALLLVQRGGELGDCYPTLPTEQFYPRVRPLDAELPADRVFRFTATQYSLVPNQLVHYGLEDVRGYQAIRHRRFLDTFPLWVAQDAPDWFTRINSPESPFLAFLNVRYAMTPRGLRPRGWRLVRRGPSLALWRNPHALERAFLPQRVVLGIPKGGALEPMGSARDFRQLAWIEAAGPQREVANGTGTLTVARRGLGLRLEAALESPAWVVVSNVAWRGWRARTGGKEIPITVANHAFLGFELPAGRHQVELSFRPRSFELGLGLSGLTLALLLGAIWWRRARRGPATPAPPPSERRTGDHVEIAGSYQYRALHQGPAPQRFWHWAKLDEALRCLDLRPGARLLDAGCGSGVLSAMAADLPGVQVVGVDANPQALAFARTHLARPNLELVEGLVDELDLAPGSFSHVVFLEVIEHLTRAQGTTTLRRFHELLAPGGRLVLSTPNRHSLWPLIEWLLDRLRLVPNLGDEQHEHLYTVAELTELARETGFAVRQVRGINTVAPWLAWLSWPLAQACHRLERRWLPFGGSIVVLELERQPSPA